MNALSMFQQNFAVAERLLQQYQLAIDPPLAGARHPGVFWDASCQPATSRIMVNIILKRST